MLVSKLPVDQQHSKVGHVEVGQDAAEAAGQGPGESHEEISHVIWVAADTPEPGDHEFRATFGRQGLEVPHGGVVWVTSEGILLGVCPTENDESEGV